MSLTPFARPRPAIASASESSDTSAAPPPRTTTGEKPESTSPLKPALGPEYQTVEDSENEIQVGPVDGHVGHLTQLVADDSLWNNQLQAQTANQTLTARLDQPVGGHDSISGGHDSILGGHDSIPGRTASETSVAEPPSGDSSGSAALPASIGRQSEPVASSGDSRDLETAPVKNGTESAAGPQSAQSADSSVQLVPVAVAAAASDTAQPQKSGVDRGQGGGQPGRPNDWDSGGLSPTHQDASGNALSADDTGMY